MTEDTNFSSGFIIEPKPVLGEKSVLPEEKKYSESFEQKSKNKKESNRKSKVSSHASARAYECASDQIADTKTETDQIGSDQIGSDQIGSDQLCDLAIDLLAQKGFLKVKLLEKREELKELIEKGLSLEMIDKVSNRVIKRKGEEFFFSINYLMKSFETALRVNKSLRMRTENLPVAAQKKTEEEEKSELREYLDKGGSPFLVKDSDFPSVQCILNDARDEWLLEEKPIEGIDALGKPIRDQKVAQRMKYFGVEDAKARISAGHE